MLPALLQINLLVSNSTMSDNEAGSGSGSMLGVGCTSALSATAHGGAIAVSQAVSAEAAAVAMASGVPILPAATAAATASSVSLLSAPPPPPTPPQQPQQLWPIAGRCRVQVEGGSSLVGNRCSGRGGALYLSSCLLLVPPASDKLGSSDFSRNSAGWGGAVAMYDAANVTSAAAAAAIPESTATAAAAASAVYDGRRGTATAATAVLVEVTGPSFRGNTAIGSGGALYVSSTEQRLSHLLVCAGCIFTANTAGEAGGAVAMEGSLPIATMPALDVGVRTRRQQLAAATGTGRASGTALVQLVVLQGCTMQHNSASAAQGVAGGSPGATKTPAAIALSGPRGGALAVFGGVAVEVRVVSEVCVNTDIGMCAVNTLVLRVAVVSCCFCTLT